MSSVSNLDQLCINTIRFLSVDGVQKANSGHPGLPMGAAPMAYVLWTKFLRHNPIDPGWPDRDRFVLSGGHGSMLLYSLLHLTGYDLSLDEIKNFRQWGSKTPGHPEYGLTPGVEVTTGPLGQGFAMGVGLAMAEAHLAARYNQPDHTIIDHYTYGIVSDGDLMEGVSHEAASLAGHWQLGKLIYLYDDNHISLAGATDLTFTEDVTKRFEAYGWQVLLVEDGNDLAAIEAALSAARSDTERPTLIRVRTIIGFGAPHKQNTFEAHGSPLGPDEVKAAKENLGWPVEPPFYIPGEALDHFRQAIENGKASRPRGKRNSTLTRRPIPNSPRNCIARLKGDLPEGWNKDLPVFPAGKGQATRVSSGQVLNAIAAKVPQIIGGSADLNPSTNTALKGLGDFQSPAVAGQRQARRGGRRVELRRTQHSLRRARTCHGQPQQRSRAARRRDSLHGDVPAICRLHAPGDPSGRADGAARDLRLHARQHLPGRRRPHASTGGASGRAARHSQSRRDSSRRCE